MKLGNPCGLLYPKRKIAVMSSFIVDAKKDAKEDVNV